MERSSPLAAMQPPSLRFGQWGFGFDGHTSNPHCGGAFGFGSGSFNFKDTSRGKPPTDYFSLKPVRGSSPTASLAADLSQNCHIDQSPQLPTPRRSLFSSNLFGTIDGRRNVTTPPLPSSSPGPGVDSMDISPLPHKAPFVVTTHQLQTPSTDTISVDCPTTSSPIDMVSDSPMEISKPSALFDRRRTALTRPSLGRTKGFSTNSVPLRSAGLEGQCPIFKFANGPSTAPTMTLDECFVPSPPQEKKISLIAQGPSLMAPPRPRLFSNLCHSRNNGSPSSGHVRKTSGPPQRPRKQMRRSLSMFENAAEIMKQGKPDDECPQGGLKAIMDVEEAYQFQLPHFTPEEDTLPRITKNTMIEVLDGRYTNYYDQTIIVDCRFEYEYKGGHIDGAINFNNKEELAKKLFETHCPQKTLLIFHCEYSAHRAPITAKFLRHQDRAANAHQYPKLTYPEVYILDGGYSSFFKDYRTRCSPQNYIEMNDKEHALACERGLGRIKQQRQKLSRAQTFAFGQHDQSLDESPSAPSRHCSDFVMGMDISVDQQFNQQMHSRRMASY